MKWLNLEQAAQLGIDVSPAAKGGASATLTTPVVNERQQGDREKRATDFIRALASRWSSPNEEAFRSLDELYADTVRYHGKLTPREDVVLDKRRFAERWPDRSYTIRPDSISATCAKEPEVCSVKGIMDRSLVNGEEKTMSRDITSFDYQIAGSGEGLYIVEETSSLAKPRGRSPLRNPFIAIGQGVPGTALR